MRPASHSTLHSPLHAPLHPAAVLKRRFWTKEDFDHEEYLQLPMQRAHNEVH